MVKTVYHGVDLQKLLIDEEFPSSYVGRTY